MLSKNCVETTNSASGNSLWRWMLNDCIQQWINYINLCIAIKREREALAKLTDAEIHDLGIHRADADAEARRSFFDIPEDRMNSYADRGEHTPL